MVDDRDALTDLLDAVAAGDAGRSLVAVADAVSAGRDPRVLGETLLARLRDVFLVRMGASTDHLPPGDVGQVQAWADQLGDRATTRALESVGDALLEMRQAPDPRIPLEVALVKLTRVDAGGVDALAERVARLEAAIAGGVGRRSPVTVRTTGTGRRRSAPAPTRGRRRAAGSPPTTDPAPPPAPGRAPARRRCPGRARRRARARVRVAPDASSRRRTPVRRRPPPSPRRQRRRAGPGAGDPRVAPATPATPPPAAVVAPDGPSSSDPAPTNEPPAAPPSTGGGLDLARVESSWTDAVLPGLGGLARAMFNVGRFIAVEGTTVVLALPNDVHRQRCEQKRPEVERALADALGTAVTLRLVVDDDPDHGDGGGGDRGPSSRWTGGGGSVRAEPEAADEVLGGRDVHDLEDAPDAPAGGLQALTEAFPGAELIDGDPT